MVSRRSKSKTSHRRKQKSAPGPHLELPVLNLNSPDAMPKLAPKGSIQDPVASRLPDAVQIDNESLLCHCPDCGAPMTVRYWLMLADCWACGVCIELTELKRGLAKQGLSGIPKPDQNPMVRGDRSSRMDAKHTSPMALPRPAPPRPMARQVAEQATTHVETATAANPFFVEQLRRPSTQAAIDAPPLPAQPASRPFGSSLSDVPAWLVSLLLHLAFLTLLALFTLTQDTPLDRILLSTTVSPDVREGGRVQLESEDDPDYDLPIPETEQPRTKPQREVLILADQQAREIRLDPDANVPYRPPVSEIRRTIGSENSQRTFAVRDPRVRIDMVKREGGTTLTEAAVARGLRWLAKHQNRDGSWSLHRFSYCDACDNRCDGRGSVVSDSAATSLSLLPFLGAGQTHLSGIYQDQVSRGLRWMLENQAADGDLRIDSRGQSGMYAHGQGAIVLCEAYAMTGDDMLRDPAQRAINFIVESQHPAGGWRYRPGEPGDTSVLGWQVMALQSARVAGLEVPEESLELSGHYLDTVMSRDGIFYSYQKSRSPTHVMTAEALLCRMYSGWTLDNPELKAGVQSLVEKNPPQRKDTNIYYWYYATQVLHHVGGVPWERWNLRLRDILVQTQEKSGHEAGSWKPKGPHANAGGRIYMTALAICTLEVYYRHAPIFRRIDLSRPETTAEISEFD